MQFQTSLSCKNDENEEKTRKKKKIVMSKANLIESIRTLMRKYLKIRFEFIEFMNSHIIFKTFDGRSAEMNFVQLCLYYYFSLRQNQWEAILTQFGEKLMNQKLEAQTETYQLYLENWINMNSRLMKEREGCSSYSYADLLISAFEQFYSINKKMEVANFKYKAQQQTVKSLLKTIKLMENHSDWQEQLKGVTDFWIKEIEELTDFQSKFDLSPYQLEIYEKTRRKKFVKTTKMKVKQKRINNQDEFFIYIISKLSGAFSNFLNVKFTAEEYVRGVVNGFKKPYLAENQQPKMSNFKIWVDKLLRDACHYGLGIFKGSRGGQEIQLMRRRQGSMIKEEISEGLIQCKSQQYDNGHQAVKVEPKMVFEPIQIISQDLNKLSEEANQGGYEFPFDFIADLLKPSSPPFDFDIEASQ